MAAPVALIDRQTIPVFDPEIFQTDRSEIYVSTQYRKHEHALNRLFFSLLGNLGWYRAAENQRLWLRNNSQTIVCLSDDFLAVGGGDLMTSPSSRFPEDTNVITDNHVDFTSDYTVWQVPISYFGVYSYRPSLQQWSPSSDLGLCIHRIDEQRTKILLEFICMQGSLDDFMRYNLVNFNAMTATGPNETLQDLVHNWRRYLPAERSPVVDTISDMLPLRNHALLPEQVHVRVWLNCVIETYAGDSHAFSEKIFRALVTPAPWVVYAADSAVAYLKSIGFDVLDDLVDHAYESHNTHWNQKINTFVEACHSNVKQIKKQNFDFVRRRCLAAAQHNQELLAKMRQQWPDDLAVWLPRLLECLS